MAVDSSVASTSLVSEYTTNESGVTVSAVRESIPVTLHRMSADLAADRQTTGNAAYTSGPGNLAAVSRPVQISMM